MLEGTRLQGYGTDIERIPQSAFSVAWSEFRRQAYVLSALFTTAIVLGALLLFVQSPAFTATMLISPMPAELSTDTSKTSYSGALSLFNRGGNSYSAIDGYRALLTSNVVAEQLAQNQALLHRLFAGSWNAEQQRWEPPAGFYALLVAKAKVALGFPPWQPPDSEQVEQFLETKLAISPTQTTLFGTSTVQEIAATLPDRQLAIDILNAVSLAADRVLRNQLRQITESQVAFLEKELARTTSQDIRNALITVLAQRLEQRTFFYSEGWYAVQVIDPPHAAYNPSSPKPIFILGSLLVFAALGSAVSLMFLRDTALPVFRISALWKRNRSFIEWVPPNLQFSG